MKHFHNSRFPRLAVCLLALGCASGAAATTLETPLPPPFAFTTTIDNPYMPLPSGSSFAYQAETDDGCEYNKVTVTSDTKPVTIDGTVYTTLVVHEQAWESEECDVATATMIEDTLDYYGMEADSRDTWYFGENTWAVADDSDECTDEGAWEAGAGGAQPGIIMLGNPEPGVRYQQEFDEDNAEDWAAVLRLNATVDIDYLDSEYDDCLVTREWTPLAPGEIEHKSYCPEPGNPGPGLVTVDELKGKTLHVEYIGPGPLGAPGEFLPFPALEEVGSCTLP